MKLKNGLLGSFLTIFSFLLLIALSAKFKLKIPHIDQNIFFDIVVLSLVLFFAKRFGYFNNLGIRWKGLFPGVIYALIFVFLIFFLDSLRSGMLFKFSFASINKVPPLFIIDLLLMAFIEELIFRGVLISNLKRLKGVLFALFASSLIFAFFHFVWLFSGEYPNKNILAYGSVYGLIWGIIFIRSNNIFPSTTAHFITNLLILMLPSGLGKPLFEAAFSLFLLLIFLGPIAVDYIESKRTKTKQGFVYSRYLAACFVILLFALLGNDLVSYF